MHNKLHTVCEGNEKWEQEEEEEDTHVLHLDGCGPEVLACYLHQRDVLGYSLSHISTGHTGTETEGKTGEHALHRVTGTLLTPSPPSTPLSKHCPPQTPQATLPPWILAE